MVTRLKSLKNHPGFVKYFKNTSWLFAEKIFRIITVLFVGIWMARYLGPEKFGLYNYAISFAGIFMAISTLGLDSIVVRELVKAENQANELIGTAFWLKLITAVLALLFLLFAIQFTENDSYTNILILIIASATIFQSFNVVDMYFQSQVLSKYMVYANIISLFISSLVKITLIINQAPLIAFAWVILFDSIVLALGFIYFFLKNSTLKIKKFPFRTTITIVLLRDSWPLILSGIAIAIYMKIDQVMINAMLNSKAVGEYAAAVQLSEGWYFIPVVITASLFPAIINAKKQSKQLYDARLQKLYDLMVWAAITIALPVTFLSDWLTNLLYGDQYHQVGGVLSIYIWAGVFVFLGVANGKWLIIENLQKFAMMNTIAGAIINIVLNYVLIPSIGILGAAWATLIAYAFSGYILLVAFKKTRRSFANLSKSLFFIT